MQNELQHYIDNPKTIEQAMAEACKNISLAAQSLAKKELEISHLQILKNLSTSLNELTFTKMLTISPDKIHLFKDAAVIEEAGETATEDLIEYIYRNSNRSSNVKKYLLYAVNDAFNLTDERIQKLFEIITVKFNGKKIDKRKKE